MKPCLTETQKEKARQMVRNQRTFGEIRSHFHLHTATLKAWLESENLVCYAPLPGSGKGTTSLNDDDIRSHKILRSVSRPSPLVIAKGRLGNDLKIGAMWNSLYIDGKYQPASLTKIMQATNRSLAADGLPQLTNNPEWVVNI